MEVVFFRDQISTCAARCDGRQFASRPSPCRVRHVEGYPDLPVAKNRTANENREAMM